MDLNWTDSEFPGGKGEVFFDALFDGIGEIVEEVDAGVVLELPFLFLLWDRGLLRLVMIPGSFLMFVGMISTIREEVRALRVNQRYTRLF